MQLYPKHHKQQKSLFSYLKNIHFLKISEYLKQFCSKMTYLILMHKLFDIVKEYNMNIHKLKLI